MCKLEKQRLKTLDVVKKAEEIHGNKYDYSHTVYTGCKNKLKIWCNSCKKFFYQRQDTHLKGYNCTDCKYRNKRKTKEQFIEKAIEIHGDKYDYDSVEYINSQTKVEIYCKKCKKYFYQVPSSHTSGCKCGCSGCSISGYNSNKKGKLYYLKIEHNNELYYKIGITNNTLKRRYRESDREKFMETYNWVFEDGNIAKQLEKRIKDYFKEHKYDYEKNGKILENGNTEIYTEDIIGELLYEVSLFE